MPTLEELSGKNSIVKIDNEAIYKIGDIVYLRPYRMGNASYDLACIGAEAEVDHKILGVHIGKEINPFSPNKIQYNYDLASGHGGHLEYIKEQFLVSPKDRAKYHNSIYLILKEDTELAKAGEVFLLNGDYWTCEAKGISIHVSRMDNLKHLFDTQKNDELLFKNDLFV